MDQLSEGTTAILCSYGYDPAYVQKVYKRSVSQRSLALQLEKAVHTEVCRLLAGAKLRVPKLRVPKLLNTDGLVMERVDVEKPLWQPEVWDLLKPEMQDNYIEILAHALNVLGMHGYVMKDVEVYLQPDNTLVMLDFGQVGKIQGPAQRRLETAAMVPPSSVGRLEMIWGALAC